jgi:CubicO group peptidase (beta-lactamase class C family)
LGRLHDAVEAPPARLDTIFDLASLTKPIATTTILMRLVQERRLALAQPVGRWLAQWRGVDREHVTIADLLEHASGLTAHLPLYRDSDRREEFERTICTLPLEYAPRTRAVYSDLGFILLGFIAENATGRSLETLFEDICAGAAIRELRYRPPAAWRQRAAPTGVDAWRGRLLAGEVHDRNAWALGGVAGHAGLFGTAASVGRFAQLMLRLLRVPARGTHIVDPDIARQFTRRSAVPGSSRAMGWDTMLPTSSCGSRLTPDAVGHTGYTGTSLWIDVARDLYVVLLTNRVHPNDRNDAIVTIRPRFHDAVVDAVDAM